MKRCHSLLLVLSLVVIAPRVAGAGDETRRARELFLKAEAKYAAKQYGEALALYQRAYGLAPLPGFHFNIGQCHRNLGDHQRALHHYEAYLAGSKNPRNRDKARQLIERCRRALQRRGQPEARAPDDGGRESPATTQPVDPTGATQPVDKPHRRYPSSYFWGAAGVSAALLVASTVSGAMALSKSAEFNDPDTAYNKLRSLKNTGVALRTTSIVTFVLGALGAAGTTVLFFYTDFGSGEAKVTAAPTAGGAALIATGRF